MEDQPLGTLNTVAMGTLNYAVVPGAIVGSYTGYIPILAAVVGMFFYLLQIWESKTVQNYLDRRRQRKEKDAQERK